MSPTVRALGEKRSCTPTDTSRHDGLTNVRIAPKDLEHGRIETLRNDALGAQLLFLLD
uniref:Uncharacterized protein n=1 Tax=Hyaloperonospora arabidopsidis (strain Emoy2) TaxID=559515 RepID=M4BHR8_HYAAE